MTALLGSFWKRTSYVINRAAYADPNEAADLAENCRQWGLEFGKLDDPEAETRLREAIDALVEDEQSNGNVREEVEEERITWEHDIDNEEIVVSESLAFYM